MFKIRYPIAGEPLGALRLRQELTSNGCHLALRDLPSVNAGIAQLVEQLICNQQVVGSNPTAGSSFKLLD
jgi:hypothetical protein